MEKIEYLTEPARKTPVLYGDVFVAGAGTAAALCAKENCDGRELPYARLREELLRQEVILDVG